MIQVHVYVLLSLYALLFVALALCLALFLSVKREIRRCEARLKKQQIYLQEAYDRLEAGMDSLKVGFREMDDKTSFAEAATLHSRLGTNKRAQATQMLRRGDRPEQIAAALSLPQNEVKLLIRVHEAALSAPPN